MSRVLSENPGLPIDDRPLSGARASGRRSRLFLNFFAIRASCCLLFVLFVVECLLSAFADFGAWT